MKHPTILSAILVLSSLWLCGCGDEENPQPAPEPPSPEQKALDWFKTNESPHAKLLDEQLILTDGFVSEFEKLENIEDVKALQARLPAYRRKYEDIDEKFKTQPKVHGEFGLQLSRNYQARIRALNLRMRRKGIALRPLITTAEIQNQFDGIGNFLADTAQPPKW